LNQPHAIMRFLRALLVRSTAVVSIAALAFTLPAQSQDHDHDADHDRDNVHFYTGNLMVSRTVYDNNAANVTVGQLLPPGCKSTKAGCPKGSGAISNGTYPTVFNNDTYDGSFGVTSKIYLDQVTPFGWLVNTLEVPNSSQPGITSSGDQLVTSFSSKSELALNLSTSYNAVSFMGYVSPIDALDISNSNTPLVPDTTNPVGETAYRAIATVDRFGKFSFTLTNAYSGNNGRAAALNDKDGANFFYTAGNAGNGGNPQPTGVVLGAGTQFVVPSTLHESAQTPSTPTPLGSFSVTQLGDAADKLGKDDNFRGLTVFNNVVYLTKGSGGNGVNTVYFVDTTGKACPNGVGLPAPGATLPTTPLSYVSPLPSTGLPNNMCILAGFPTALAKVANPVAFPFGLWFANDHTLYVADEGDGFTDSTATGLYTHAAAQTTAGLQKWIFDSRTGTWNYAYTLQAGLDLGTPYIIASYPTGNNSVTGLPWAPATDGLRNITGKVDGEGNATIWGITSTVSGSGDQGADPNRLVVIRDNLHKTDASDVTNEKFYTLRQAGFAEVLRGVSFTPGTKADDDRDDRHSDH
jgi:hypothetical protein